MSRFKLPIPTDVTVAGRIYEVNVETREWAEEHNLLGQCDSATQVISLSPTHSTHEQMLDTLLHEILHAIWYQYRVYHTMPIDQDAREEALVDTLGSALAQVFLENPALLKTICAVQREVAKK